MKRILLILVLSLMCSACMSQNEVICYDKHVDAMTEREFEFCKAWILKTEINVSNYSRR